MNLISNKY